MCCYGKNNLGAGILAGGQSVRMGQNKALLPWQDTNFLLHICNQFSGFGEILLSVNDKQLFEKILENASPPGHASPPYRLLEDERKGYGPLEGLYQILLHTRMEYVFIAAVDMPLINQDFISTVMEGIPFSGDCMILKDDRGVHPLCGVYKKNVASVIERLRREQKHSMYQLLDRIAAQFTELKMLKFYDGVLTNINTKKEYEGLLRNGRTYFRAQGKYSDR